MPQATPARTTDRDRLKTRPSVAARGVSAENAPVLFRLPVIAMAAGVENAEPVVSSAVPPPVVERAAPAGVTSSEGTATISFPAVQASGTTTATGNASSSSMLTGVSQANTAHTTAVQINSATTLMATRSWWEHWSSGVVLILLIIALVTASILALNDDSKSKQDQLASDPVSVNLDDFDLSNITIPDIAVSKSVKVNGAEESKTAAVANGSESGATLVGNAGEGHDSESRATKVGNTATLVANNGEDHDSESRATKVGNTATLVANNGEGHDPESRTTKVGNTATLVANNGESHDSERRATKVGNSATLATPMASLTVPATANVVANPAQTPKSATSGSSTQPAQSAQYAATPAPLASLAIPVGVVPPPLFNPKSDRAGDVRPNVSGGLPSLTASGPTASQNLSTPHSGKTAPAQLGVPGASPQLYDGAGIATELHAASAETTATPTPSSGPVDTNLPSYATILASATQPMATSPGAPAGQTQSAPGASQPAAGMTDPYGRSGIVNTATPELDTQAVINAYLPYSQTNQASNGAASNRYGLPAQPAPSVAPQTTQPGGRGFMLGN